MNKTKYFLFFSVASIMFSGSFSSLPVAHALGNQITLEELGVLQLAAHDLFNVNRVTEIDIENGKLDLSTLFTDMTNGMPFSLTDVAVGGEPRNRENILLFSIASDIGQNYVDDIMINGLTEQVARQNALNDYHARFNSAYLSAFGESVPNPINGCVTMTENLAFRTVHDFLPGEIFIDSNNDMSLDTLVLTLDFTPPFDDPGDNPFGHTGPLTPVELLQLGSDLNGDFDTQFNNIVIFIPPSTTIIVDLEAADHSFGVQFLTDFSFQHFLDELVDGSYDPNEDVMNEIRHLIAKGYGGCIVGGEIIPIETTALLLAGAQTFSWIIPVALSVLGIGLFVVSRKPENS